MIVARVPIVPLIEKVLRLVSKIRPEYDKVYHLYALLTLGNGVVLRIERNQTFQMQPASQKDMEMKVEEKPEGATARRVFAYGRGR